jgi:hypothetical protein
VRPGKRLAGLRVGDEARQRGAPTFRVKSAGGVPAFHDDVLAPPHALGAQARAGQEARQCAPGLAARVLAGDALAFHQHAGEYKIYLRLRAHLREGLGQRYVLNIELNRRTASGGLRARNRSSRTPPHGHQKKQGRPFREAGHARGSPGLRRGIAGERRTPRAVPRFAEGFLYGPPDPGEASR